MLWSATDLTPFCVNRMSKNAPYFVDLTKIYFKTTQLKTKYKNDVPVHVAMLYFKPF